MEFSFREWNLPLIQEPNKLMKKLKELNIKGKKITIYIQVLLWKDYSMTENWDGI